MYLQRLGTSIVSKENKNVFTSFLLLDSSLDFFWWCRADLFLHLSAAPLVARGAHRLLRRGALALPVGALLHVGRGALLLVDGATLLVVRGATRLVIHRAAHLHICSFIGITGLRGEMDCLTRKIWLSMTCMVS